jgi:hypothetical protein
MAYTQEQGAEIIGRRILSQLRRRKELQPEDFTFAVSSSLLPPIARDINESTESFVDRVATGMRDHINTICLQVKN